MKSDYQGYYILSGTSWISLMKRNERTCVEGQELGAVLVPAQHLFKALTKLSFEGELQDALEDVMST